MCLHYSGRSTACTKPRAHTQSITSNTFPQKGTMIPNMAQSRYPLNNQVLAIFLPFATIPATPHYSLSSIHYVFSTVWYVNITFFSTFLPLSTPLSASNLFLNHTASPIKCTPPSLTPDPILVILSPSSFSHSLNLGCVGAQSIMFLGRFLV